MNKLEAWYQELYEDHLDQLGEDRVSETKFQNMDEFNSWLKKTKQIEFDPNDDNIKQFEDYVNKNKGRSVGETLSKFILPPFQKEWPKKYNREYPDVIFQEWSLLNQNAHLFTGPYGAAVILDSALFYYIQASVGLIVRSRAFQDAYFANSASENLIEDEEVVSVFVEMNREIIEHGHINESTLFKYLFYPHEGGKYEVASLLGTNVITFIIAHELAHLHLGHIPIESKQPTDAESLLASLYSQHQELEADQMAFDMVLDDTRIVFEGISLGKFKESNEDMYERMISLQCMAIMLMFEVFSWRQGIQWNEIEKNSGEKLNAYFFSHPTTEKRSLELMKRMIEKHPWIQGTVPITSVLKPFKEKIIPEYAKYY